MFYSVISDGDNFQRGSLYIKKVEKEEYNQNDTNTNNEKNDIHRVNRDIDILCMKCFHSIGIKDGDTIQIQKQLVYTISLFQVKFNFFHSN